MKYVIPYFYHIPRHPLIAAWKKEHGYNQIGFYTWLKDQTKCSSIKGNFNEGWTLEFDDEAHYTWVLLKWPM